MKKKKRLILIGAAVICLIVSVWLSVLRFSSDNIANSLDKCTSEVYTVDRLEMVGWNPAEGGYVSAGNATVALRSEEAFYVRNLLVDGALDKEVTDAVVWYTESPDEAFSPDKYFLASVSVKNKDIYLKIDRTVSALQIGFYGEAGGELELDRIVLNPRNWNVHYQLLILLFLLPFLVIAFIAEGIFEKEHFLKSFISLKDYRYLLWDLVSRDIKTKYRRSFLGIMWSVLNPLLMMLVLTAVFANIFRYQIDDFPVYYLTGYILFNFVSEATNFSMTSIIGAAGLIKKVYIPKIIFPLEKCLFSLVNLLFSLIAAVIVFLIVGVTPQWSMLMFPVPILYLFIFNFGLSLILATLNTFFRDVGYLYGVFITVWMYLTPIIYPIGILPGWMQSIVRLNPLTLYVEYFRSVTVYGIVPSLSENLICLSFSLIFLLAGVLIFERKQNKFIFYV